ncbi:VOC family protein [Chenggangzhangella methanolivorans]|uniref:VOC family protein n=1 Tax=Chenggangzhangella methanolivorans TaxID=1437009 RepID=A0A9E6RBI7_9HYPH|nr:VOC family protein [Chenggangzhangella methanolivorans]QZO00163.1 VOC family protein [Chenggangzhangella methanolivorans]
MSKISPCIWFDSDGEDAANFYVSLLPDSRIDRVTTSPGDFPGGKAGDVLLIEFTLAGQTFQALNGRSAPQHTDSVSLSVDCADQAEVDRVWDAIRDKGGKEVACGWIHDRWGVRWQIVPRALSELIADPDPEVASRVFTAMMGMVKIDVAAIEAAAGKRAA